MSLPFVCIELRQIKWYAPVMGAVAALLPASGAPIAGGIIFFPILTSLGVCSADAVAFSAATQFLGCGVFAPLNWLVQDPSVFNADIFKLALPPGALGLALGLYLCTLGAKSMYIVWTFIFFSLFVLAYTLQGLLGHRLITKDTPAPADAETSGPIDAETEGGRIVSLLQADVKQGAQGGASQTDSAETNVKEAVTTLPGSRCDDPLAHLQSCPVTWTNTIAPTWPLLLWYSACCCFGGLLVAFIGIGIEKVAFIIATWQSNVHTRDASVSSIVVVGWLSGLSAGARLLSPTCPFQRGYMGNLPFELWISVLPGIFLGSVCGPWIAKTVGSRTIMWLFCAFLLVDVVENCMLVSGALGDGCSSSSIAECATNNASDTMLPEHFDGLWRIIRPVDRSTAGRGVLQP